MLHLSVLCDDAEFFPALGDRLQMTSAVEKRNRLLDKALMLAKQPPIFISLSDKEQLVAGNAFIRQMVKLADTTDKLEGYKKVCGYLEGKEFLRDARLLDQTLKNTTTRSSSTQMRLIS